MDKQEKKDKLLRYAIYYYVILIPCYIGFWYFAKNKLDASLLNSNVNKPGVEKPPPSLTNTLVTNGRNVLLIVVVVILVMFFFIIMILFLRKKKQTKQRQRIQENEANEENEDEDEEDEEIEGNNENEQPESEEEEMAIRLMNARPPPLPWYSPVRSWAVKLIRIGKKTRSDKHRNAVGSLGYDLKTAVMFNQLMHLYPVGSKTDSDQLDVATKDTQESFIDMQKSQDSFIRMQTRHPNATTNIDRLHAQMVQATQKHTTKLDKLFLIRNRLAYNMKTNDLVAITRAVPVIPPKHEMDTLVKSHTPKGTMMLFGEHTNALKVNMMSALLEIDLCAPFMAIPAVYKNVQEMANIGVKIDTLLQFIRESRRRRLLPRITDATNDIEADEEERKNDDAVEVLCMLELAKEQVKGLEKVAQLRKERYAATIAAEKKISIIASKASDALSSLSDYFDISGEKAAKKKRKKEEEEKEAKLQEQRRAAEQIVKEAQQEADNLDASIKSKAKYEILRMKQAADIAIANQKGREEFLREIADKQLKAERKALRKENEKEERSQIIEHLKYYMKSYKDRSSHDDIIEDREMEINTALNSGEVHYMAKEIQTRMKKNKETLHNATALFLSEYARRPRNSEKRNNNTEEVERNKRYQMMM